MKSGYLSSACWIHPQNHLNDGQTTRNPDRYWSCASSPRWDWDWRGWSVPGHWPPHCPVRNWLKHRVADTYRKSMWRCCRVYRKKPAVSAYPANRQLFSGRVLPKCSNRRIRKETIPSAYRGQNGRNRLPAGLLPVDIYRPTTGLSGRNMNAWPILYSFLQSHRWYSPRWYWSEHRRPDRISWTVRLPVYCIPDWYQPVQKHSVCWHSIHSVPSHPKSGTYSDDYTGWYKYGPYLPAAVQVHPV